MLWMEISTLEYTFTLLIIINLLIGNRGGAVAQPVEPATPGEEVPGSIPAMAARSLLWVGVSMI